MPRFGPTRTRGYTSTDPAYQTTGQRYAFTNNNPLNLVDPLGLWGVWDTISAIGLGIGLVGPALTGVGLLAEVAAIVAEAADAAALASESADAALEETTAANAPRAVL